MGLIHFENKPIFISGIKTCNTPEQVNIIAKFRFNGQSDIRINAVKGIINEKIKVKNLDINGTIKISLCHLTDEYPTFKIIKICFKEVPKIDFKLVLIGELTYFTSFKD